MDPPNKEPESKGVYDSIIDFLWDRLKSILEFLFYLLVARTNISSRDLIIDMLNSQAKVLYAKSYYYSVKDNKNWPSDFRIYLYKGRLIGVYDDFLTLKGTNTIEFLIEEAKEYSRSSPKATVSITSVTGCMDKFGSNTINTNEKDVRAPIYALSTELKSVLAECTKWKKNEEWFRQKCLPWRRGFLLYGLPGTGKSSFINYVGAKINSTVVYIDLGSMTNALLDSTTCNLYKTIVVFEDIDCIFNKRETIRGQVTFDCFLNILSRLDGCLVFVTTNNIHTIDYALGVATESGMSSRPGRLDRAVKMPDKLDYAGMLFVAKSILKDTPNELEYIATVMEQGINDSPAQFQERCSQIAHSTWDDS
jgi:hypothetical protein